MAPSAASSGSWAPPPSARCCPQAPLPSLPGVCAGCLLGVLVFMWSRAGSGTWSPSCCEEMGVGGSLVFPQDDRMALGQETMGPGRGQVLCPGQEKDNLKINRAPPMDLNSGLQRGGHDCPSLGAPRSWGRRGEAGGGGGWRAEESREKVSARDLESLVCSGASGSSVILDSPIGEHHCAP